jgi:hypothetical protein
MPEQIYTVIGYYREADEVTFSHVTGKDAYDALVSFFSGQKIGGLDGKDIATLRRERCKVVAVLLGQHDDLTADLYISDGLIGYEDLEQKQTT